MSRLLWTILLTVGATLPRAASALGLGELHVESALGQAFVAHIDLIDASRDDLARLSAAIADEDAFQRQQLPRPDFLGAISVSVGQGANGGPILRLLSTASFTEPVVTFLLDVHWPNGELIREYTALLDPSERASETDDSAARAPSPPAAVPLAQMPASAPDSTPAPRHTSGVGSSKPMQAADHEVHPRSYTVARGDTVARIARAAGARSRKERNRMMIAIFRANPAAFQGNLNALHRGVILRLPTAEELAAISPAEADREYKAQRAAWHTRNAHTERARTPAPAAPALDAATSSAAHSEVRADPAPEALEAERLALTHRVEALEQSLQETRRELQQRTQTIPAVVARPASERARMSSEPADAARPPSRHRAVLIALLGAIGLGSAIALWFVRRRQADKQVSPHSPDAEPSRIAVEAHAESGAAAPAAEPSAHEPATSLPSPSQAREPGVEGQLHSQDVHLTAAAATPQGPAGQTGETTTILAPDIEASGDTVEHGFSFYNPESHSNTTHVVMGTELTQPLAFVERRKNPAIVLQQAIEREPQRTDLQLKLLELYYASASENRLAFLEAARQIVRKQDLVSAEDWARIADMGRRIAPDDELFRSALDDQAVA